MLKSIANIFKSITLLSLLCAFLIGGVLGVLSTLSFLRTVWPGYSPDFFLWWSVFSTIASVLIVIFSVWQYLSAENQKGRTKAQVKIWMQDANGIVEGLDRIKNATYSEISDVFNSIYILEASAAALLQSLYEERVLKEEDYQTREKRIAEIAEEQRVQNMKDKGTSMGANRFTPARRAAQTKKPDKTESMKPLTNREIDSKK